MNIQIIYRSYKPLHELYKSFQIKPPEGVEFTFPKPKKYLRRLLYPFYRRYGDKQLIKKLINLVQKIFFDNNSMKKSDCDIVHFLQMLPSQPLQKPYIIDIEHAASLANFTSANQETRDKIFDYLQKLNCKKIIALSHAARKTLEYLLKQKYPKIKKKVEVVYPALPNFYELYKNEVDFSITGTQQSTLRLLFVGNTIYRKGLHETLEAFTQLLKKNYDMTFYVVSDAPPALKQKYNSNRITYRYPTFSKEEIIKKLFLPCNVFVMPTHGDTFGMVFLDALSSGTPVITTRQFATPEIIKEGYNGLFVKSNRLFLEEVRLPNRKCDNAYFARLSDSIETNLVSDLVEKIEHLYLKRNLLKKMSRNARKDFQNNGKFSIGVRNKKLKQIYKKALQL